MVKLNHDDHSWKQEGSLAVLLNNGNTPSPWLAWYDDGAAESLMAIYSTLMPADAALPQPLCRAIDFNTTTTKHLPAPFSAYHNQDVWYSQLTNTSAVMNCAFEQGGARGDSMCKREEREEGVRHRRGMVGHTCYFPFPFNARLL